MNVVVVGSGYVGLVTGACLAEMGNLVTCIDSDSRRIAQLSLGVLPFFEPGLEALVQRNFQQKRLTFACDLRDSVAVADIVFIAVGTPQLDSGAADTRQVMAAAETAARYAGPGCVFVNKSTSPVGTVDAIRELAARVMQERGLPGRPHVASNPEFLREGSAVDDFMRPDRIVVGVDQVAAEKVMRELYAPFVRNHDRLIVMGVRDAELTKYAANAMLATRISFMNEMARLCNATGADVENVRRGIGSDTRIGYSFLYAGCGYGGSCFPKDVSALAEMLRRIGIESSLLGAVVQINEVQKRWAFEVLRERFEGDFSGRTIAVWGLAFKPETDDLREAPAKILIEQLLGAGAKVLAHDPAAMPRARAEWPVQWFESGNLQLTEDPYAVMDGADALVLVTEWKPFRAPDFHSIKARMNGKLIVDGRNQYDPVQLRSQGFDYCGVGRGTLVEHLPGSAMQPQLQRDRTPLVIA